MRDLNSIVITGKVDSNWDKERSQFWVKCRRKKVSFFCVVIKGKYLSKYCRENITKGLQVRVVGSWEEDHILADHVEVVE